MRATPPTGAWLRGSSRLASQNCLSQSPVEPNSLVASGKELMRLSFA